MGVIARHSIQGTMVTYIGVAVGFVTTFFVLTRFLTTEEVGLARTLLDAGTLFIGLAQLGTSSSIIRFFPYFRDNNRHHGFFFWTIIVPIIGFVFFSLVWWACHAPIADWLGEKSPRFVDYYWMVLPLAFFMLYQTIFETNANVLMRIVVPRAVREIGVRVGLLAVYLLYAGNWLTISGFVMALCVVYAIAALINLIYLFSLGSISLQPDISFLRNNKPLVKNYLFYTGFLIISSLTGVLAPLLSSFFITAQMGLSYTGIFAIATYIAVMVSIPYRSVIAIASPQLAAAIKDGDRAQATLLMRQCSNNLLLIGGFILLLVWLNIDLIYYILPNGKEYSQAKEAVLLLALSQLISATFNIALNTLNFSRYYAFSLLWAALLTGSAIVFNNILVPRLGMTGAALSNLLSVLLYFVCVLTTVCTTTRTSPFSWDQVKGIGLLGAVFVLNMLWLRYIPLSNIWISSLLRTTILLGGAAYIAIKAHLSDEINALLCSIFIQRH